MERKKRLNSNKIWAGLGYILKSIYKKSRFNTKYLAPLY